ncbi:Hypothetical_protein [Hexamita inflata]|uniref:Hypothetical_protein n=1 Tax=Hexamita inflata TaxID=28002 RepID=A0AA86TVB1_9EUKA|nr:Hypothetical protein HINF_LOCUS17611 [Hexamita inflata]
MKKLLLSLLKVSVIVLLQLLLLHLTKHEYYKYEVDDRDTGILKIINRNIYSISNVAPLIQISSTSLTLQYLQLKIDNTYMKKTKIQINNMNDQAWRFDVRAEEALLKYQLCLV